MSSTNRGASRIAHDYYRTNPEDIRAFLGSLSQMRSDFASDYDSFQAAMHGIVLDPAAGGNTSDINWDYTGKGDFILIPPTPSSYPSVLTTASVRLTVDIREDAPVDFPEENFLNFELDEHCVDLAITNPPFILAQEFLLKMLKVTKLGGWVVLLLRLNFFGSKKRREALWKNNLLPNYAFVHSERLSFLPNGKTDSIEYMHAMWHVGQPASHTRMYIV